MDSRLRGNDVSNLAFCHSREGGNPGPLRDYLQIYDGTNLEVVFHCPNTCLLDIEFLLLHIQED